MSRNVYFIRNGGCISFKESNGYKDFSFIMSGNYKTCEVFQEFLMQNVNVNDTKLHKDANSDSYKLIYGGNIQVGEIMKLLYSNSSILFFPKKIYRASECLPEIKPIFKECFDLLEETYDYVIPPSFRDDYILFNDYFKMIYMCQKMYSQMLNSGIKPEDARYILPSSCCTEIVVSFNFREARHIFEVRCDPHAQWEIRETANEMLRILNEQAPSVFGDLVEKFLN